jgi:threonine dehydratase
MGLPDSAAKISERQSRHLVGVELVREAQARITGLVRRTPVLEVDGPNGGPVSLKLENFQRSGSFKLRGALNRILFDERAHERVAAASGGNHGIAVAHACHMLGIAADVFVPSTSPAEKIYLIQQTGATLHVVDGAFPEVNSQCSAFAHEHDALFVHPYDDAQVIAGQGTLALEILEQLPSVTMVLASVGGGGLAAGVAAGLDAKAKLVAVEPRSSPTLAAALKAGRPVRVPVGGVAADSLGAPVLGAIAYDILATTLETLVEVSDEEIVAAQRWLWEACRLPVEPAAACAWAALTSGRLEPGPDERLAVICCGGNLDLTDLTKPRTQRAHR